MEEKSMNLTEEITKEMQKLQFADKNIAIIQNHKFYSLAQSQDLQQQRLTLAMLFYELLTEPTTPAPSQIRLALNIAVNPVAWLDDMKLVVLPFLKNNEDKFFG